MDKYTLCVDNLPLLGITLPFLNYFKWLKSPLIHTLFSLASNDALFHLKSCFIQNYPHLVVSKRAAAHLLDTPHIGSSF